jgi:hypothetical protein
LPRVRQRLRRQVDLKLAFSNHPLITSPSGIVAPAQNA